MIYLTNLFYRYNKKGVSKVETQEQTASLSNFLEGKKIMHFGVLILNLNEKILHMTDGQEASVDIIFTVCKWKDR